METNELKKEINDYVEKENEKLWKLAIELYDNPELYLREYKTSEILSTFLENEGFTVERGVGTLETAFIASYSKVKGSKPRIDILAELDAIDMGERFPENERVQHACGHNIISTTATGAGTAIKYIMDKYNLQGEIRVVGTPAEEQVGGKIIMLENGVFDDTDASMVLHPTSGTSKIAGRCKSSMSFEVTYNGFAAHIGNHREKGINAQDAGVIFYTSIAALRYQTKDEIQMFVKFTDVGKEEGIIPSKCKMLVAVKCFNPLLLDGLAPKIRNCAEGAALATGCTVEIEEKRGYKGRIYNHTFEKYLRKNFEMLGEPLKEGMVDDNGGEDFGDVMRKIPGIMPYPTLIPEKRVSLHTKEYLEHVISPRAKYVVGLGSKVMAYTTLDLLLDPSIIEEAKVEMAKELQKEKEGE
ncbi:amidohydrolase [uncultured Traorella sp.]|uniref:amidohydrolase n=1 Tax=uncultured Traorella sp. TaxID=1929048 RepID=UPI0025FA4040|nr:amidohydrolase [uncultured Traorella sp.]